MLWSPNDPYTIHPILVYHHLFFEAMHGVTVFRKIPLEFGMLLGTVPCSLSDTEPTCW